MGRVPPRKPDWLVSDFGLNIQPEGARRSASDNTARVLEFPTTGGPRRAGTAGSEPVQGPARPGTALSLAGSLEGLRASVLSPEPAYKSVLGRLARAGLTDNILDAQPSVQVPNAAQLSKRAEQVQAPIVPAAAGAQWAIAARHSSEADALPAGQPAAPRVSQQHELEQQRSGAPEPPLPLRRPALPSSDPVLQQQLKDRIEKAKAEIKQQLSPMFRVSHMLRTAQDASQAAQALEDVAAASYAGFDLLGGRPDSAAAGAAAISAGVAGISQVTPPPAAPGGQEIGGIEQQMKQGAWGQRWPESAMKDNPLFNQPTACNSEESQGSPSAEDMDSLVLSARAAVSKAQSTIADLASPPRHTTATAQAGQHGSAAAAEPHSDRDAPAWQPQPHSLLRLQVSSGHGSAQQEQQEQPPAACFPLSQAPLSQPPGPIVDALPPHLLVPLEAPPDDLEGHIAQLRHRSEAVIRHECDKLIASMHVMFDEFLLSVQQHGLLVRVSGSASHSSSPSASAGAPRATWPTPSLHAPCDPALPLQQQPGIGDQPIPAMQQVGQEAGTAAADSGGMHMAGGDAAEDHGGSRGDDGDAVHDHGSCGSVAAPNAVEQAFEFPHAQLASAGGGAESGSSWQPSTQLQALEGPLGSLGFGSPIRLSASQRPSPAKGTVRSYDAAGQQATPPSSLATAVSRQPAAQALFSSRATPMTAATAASGSRFVSRLGLSNPAASPLHSQSFLTARSSASPSISPGMQATSRFQPAPTAAAAVTPAGLTRSAAPTGHRRDLDSIVNSIRRLAAETTLKQGLPPANSRLLQPLSSARVASFGGASGPDVETQHRLASQQTPAFQSSSGIYLSAGTLPSKGRMHVGR